MKTETLIERTKGEWKVSGTSKSLQRFHIEANNQNIVAVFTSIPEAEANAAFICKAVNNYDSLLAENEQLKGQLNSSSDYDYLVKQENEKLKAINDSLLNALKKIMDSADNHRHVEFYTFDTWCDDIKETIKNAEA